MSRPVAITVAEPALERLAKLGPLDRRSQDLVHACLAQTITVPARQELQHEGGAVADTRLVVSGWAGRVRFLPDGRRQLLSFMLPGDLIGYREHSCPRAISSVIALTRMKICVLPPPAEGSDLQNAFRISRALDETHLLAQITRIGRLSAQERLCDLFLELYERLSLGGLTRGRAFPMPLTQEVIADALGLTTVHLNRMVQQARRVGDLEWKGGWITLSEPDRLAGRIGHVSVPVSMA